MPGRKRPFSRRSRIALLTSSSRHQRVTWSSFSQRTLARAVPHPPAPMTPIFTFWRLLPSLFVSEEEEIRALLRAERAPVPVRLALVAIVLEANHALSHRALRLGRLAAPALVVHGMVLSGLSELLGPGRPDSLSGLTAPAKLFYHDTLRRHSRRAREHHYRIPK